MEYMVTTIRRPALCRQSLGFGGSTGLGSNLSEVTSDRVALGDLLKRPDSVSRGVTGTAASAAGVAA